MKLTKTILCLMLLRGGLSSCVREDFDDCYSINKLILSYKGDGTTEIFPDKICRVEMFVFDAENKCVNSSILSQAQVTSRTVVLPSLKPGEYRIICLGNTHDTKIDNITSGDFNQMRFAAGNYFTRTEITGNDSLYYASTSYTIKPFTARVEENVQTVEFASSHYDLSVEVAGIPAPELRAETYPALQISGVAPVTNFENQVTEETTDYLLETEYEPENKQLTARTNIMRHENHDEVTVRVISSQTGAPLAEVNLGEFLAANPAIDCSKHEVLIPIRIEFIAGSVSISLPQWYVEQVKPEF